MNNREHYILFEITPALLIGLQTIEGYTKEEPVLRVTQHRLHFLCFVIGWIITEPLNEKWMVYFVKKSYYQTRKGLSKSHHSICIRAYKFVKKQQECALIFLIR